MLNKRLGLNGNSIYSKCQVNFHPSVSLARIHWKRRSPKLMCCLHQTQPLNTISSGHLILLRKLFSLILLLRAFLIAEFRSSLAFWASRLSSLAMPAGRSIDCSSIGIWTVCVVPWLPVLRARAALEASRRCFFDLAMIGDISSGDWDKKISSDLRTLCKQRMPTSQSVA